MGSEQLGPISLVLRAEAERGNEARLFVEERQLRGEQAPYALLRHPMDREAVEAAFALGDSLEWLPATVGPQQLVDHASSTSLVDGAARPGWSSRRRHDAWWSRWRSGPQQRIRLPDDYVPALLPLQVWPGTADTATVDLNLLAGEIDPTRLPWTGLGLEDADVGSGWSAWRLVDRWREVRCVVVPPGSERAGDEVVARLSRAGVAHPVQVWSRADLPPAVRRAVVGAEVRE
jgi:hypothetical protein